MKKIVFVFLAVVMIFLSIRLTIMHNIGERSETQEVENVKINELTGIKINGLIEGEKEDEWFIPTHKNILELKTLQDMKNYLYSVDETAYMEEADFDLDRLLAVDVTEDLYGREPKILIFHTHSQEAYADSRPGYIEDTVVGMGAYLAGILAEEYGVSVVHDVGKYDFADGKVERGHSYENMEPAVNKILERYPSIAITIDIHRDGVPDDVHLVTQIEGKPTAKLMFFNGISKENANGTPREVKSLKNPYIKGNLALSLHAQLTANEIYPALMRRIYIRPYRYSLHLRPKSMLVEAGANTNTVEEVRNAMDALAVVLMETFGGAEP